MCGDMKTAPPPKCNQVSVAVGGEKQKAPFDGVISKRKTSGAAKPLTTKLVRGRR
jgi:hypothetical protein